MKVTKIFKEGMAIDDCSQDKVKAEFTFSEFTTLETILWYAKYHGIRNAKEMLEALDEASKEAKFKWVK